MSAMQTKGYFEFITMVGNHISLPQMRLSRSDRLEGSQENDKNLRIAAAENEIPITVP